ncbi:hypothetical protein K432DRAFT_447496 [Lepidopterella palustris CBS 459.81]|uniref:Uncharacterized protein n=1 Tax=Lepidopterella palustris CBS 459.81 TaxID=1314670 RepID=A0A8E2J968_9PEZI|nr:hypothetical protein K432DRAFT_447496 [Lepidopterella palustris CBS 459.81]
MQMTSSWDKSFKSQRDFVYATDMQHCGMAGSPGGGKFGESTTIKAWGFAAGKQKKEKVLWCTFGERSMNSKGLLEVVGGFEMHALCSCRLLSQNLRFIILTSCTKCQQSQTNDGSQFWCGKKQPHLRSMSTVQKGILGPQDKLFEILSHPGRIQLD